jgi:hypothetical protein
MLSHRVQGTYLRGELVFDGEKVRASPGTGRFVRPAFTGMGPAGGSAPTAGSAPAAAGV